MNAICGMAIVLACAQFRDTKPAEIEIAEPFHPAESRIVAVTVYQGQALVTREVKVPEGEGTRELVVTPIPTLALDGSLYAEGSDGIRVLSTRFRTRAVEHNPQPDVRTKEEQLRSLQNETKRLQSESQVQDQDLRFVEKLEGFAQSSLTHMTDDRRLDVDSILKLTKSLMDIRQSKSRESHELRQAQQRTEQSIAFLQRQIQELSTRSVSAERDAILVVQSSKRDAGVVRMSYLVEGARWSPRYRLRATADGGPVRLEYLAELGQFTGEPWPQVKLTFSNARPNLDAAPPELLPLTMNLSESSEPHYSPHTEELSRRIREQLERPVDMHFANETPLTDVLKYVRSATTSEAMPEGLPIYLDPIGLQEAERTETSPIRIDLSRVPLGTSLRLALRQLGLDYMIKGGVLHITSEASEDFSTADAERFDIGSPEMAGMAGMGTLEPGYSLEQSQAVMNHRAASDQSRELRVAETPSSNDEPAERDGPSLTFNVAGIHNVPSRRDPQLLEVARADLTAEYHDKAVPVLTRRVYRLAKLTNTREFVILPGEATVYVESEFVGRMRLPLVAAGEPFLAGFGVDPQVQVSRRLLRKSRTIQGGNQVYTYEFRLGLRNYRSEPVKVELWDRLPATTDESAAVNLVKTSAELSTDPGYLRTARTDNLLRWDVEVPKETVGEKTFYLTYEFKLEYAREMPQPRFLSGAINEQPISGSAIRGAMGGMGGMGFR